MIKMKMAPTEQLPSAGCNLEELCSPETPGQAPPSLGSLPPSWGSPASTVCTGESLLCLTVAWLATTNFGSCCTPAEQLPNTSQPLEEL